MALNKIELFALIEQLFKTGVQGNVTAAGIRQALNEVVNFAEATGFENLDFEYDPADTYNTTTNKYAEANGRLYKSKREGNTGNIPPDQPDPGSGDYENFWWTEISKNDGLLQIYQPGVFGEGVVLVFRELNGNKLWHLSDAAVRPFESTDFAAEATGEEAVWLPLGGSESAEFNGNRAIKTLPVEGFNPGPEATTTKLWIEKTFYGFLYALISLDDFPLQEVGASYAPQVVGTITPREETDISARAILEDSISINSPVGNSINFAAPAFTVVLGDNKIYKITAAVGGNGTPGVIESAAKKTEGVFPYLIGSSADGALTGAALYDALTKVVEKEGDKSFTFNFSNQYAYFGIHEDYADLVQIVDQNGFPLSGFLNSKQLVPATKTGAWTENYKLYRSGLTTINSGTFQFNR